MTKIHIHFSEGMNPFIGLHDFISWDVCGIEKGNILTIKEYDKLSDVMKPKAKSFTDEEGKEVYFMAKETARNFICKHLGKGVPAKDLFTPQVFTREILEELDEKVIQPTFKFAKIMDVNDELYDLLGESDEEDNNEDE